MSCTETCDNCKQEILATVKHWAVVLNQESHCDGGITVFDNYYLHTLCGACSEQFDLQKIQIRDCKVSHNLGKYECDNSELEKNNRPVYAACETCKKEIYDNTKYWAVFLHQESFREEENSFFASITSVHVSLWLYIFCETCVQKKDFGSLEIPTRQSDSQERECPL